MVMFYIFFVCLPREYSIIPRHSRDIPMIFQGYSVTWSVKIPVKKFRSLSRGQVLTFNTGMVAFSKQSLWEEAVPSFVKCQKRDRFVDRTSTFFLWRMMGFYRTCSTLFFFFLWRMMGLIRCAFSEFMMNLYEFIWFYGMLRWFQL